MVGTTRRARLLTAGTVLALALAVVAFIVLPANEESVPRNDYVIAADHICVVSKEQVAAAGVKAANGQGPQSVERFGRQLVLIAAQWRAALASHGAPAAQIDQARALDVALRDVEVGAGVLTVAAERGQGDLVGLARKLDERTREVESAIADMGLSHCARLVLAPVAGASS